MKRMISVFLLLALLCTGAFSFPEGALAEGMVVTDTSGITNNTDGSYNEGPSSLLTPPAEEEGSTPHLTQEEWEARWEKYATANGVTTGTVYTDNAGAAWPAELLFLGLGRSTISVNGQRMLVPTSSLRWDTEAPEDKLLAVVLPTKQTYLTLRAKKSQKSFVMGHCEKCTVLRVIRTGKTWTMVDAGGVRGIYCLEKYDGHKETLKVTVVGNRDGTLTVTSIEALRNVGNCGDSQPGSGS